MKYCLASWLLSSLMVVCLVFGSTLSYADSFAAVGKWEVRHGDLYINYAFANDGNYKYQRHGDGFFEEETGTYDVKGDSLILMPSGKPKKGFRWRLGRESIGQLVLWLTDSFGEEMFYSDPPR